MRKSIALMILIALLSSTAFATTSPQQNTRHPGRMCTILPWVCMPH
ncbi:MAG TPA: hypothetical protein VLG68_08510 [Gammaproteobacteria bacterium]|nr:hypothetical protein [Gammaproteobacteria bacterium]